MLPQEGLMYEENRRTSFPFLENKMNGILIYALIGIIMDDVGGIRYRNNNTHICVITVS